MKENKEKKTKKKAFKMEISEMYYFTGTIWICAAIGQMFNNETRMMAATFFCLAITWFSLAAMYKKREKKRERVTAYYNKEAEEFFNQTFDVDMSENRNRFTAYVPENGVVLDWGCGSGRDTIAMQQAGYQVEATDVSEELCKLVAERTGIEVRNESFDDLTKTRYYDGIWACASLLHVEKEELGEVIRKAEHALKNNGVLYMSFKYGDFEGERDGRFFKDWTEQSLKDKVLKYHRKLEVVDTWVSTDVREGHEEQKWLNVILRKRAKK